MKKLLLLFAVLAVLVSCSMEEDKLKFEMEFIPVAGVIAPDTMQRGQTYDIIVKYSRPNDCYYFDGFYHEMDGAAHVFAVQTLVIQDAECQPINTLTPEEGSFQFTCPVNYSDTSYLFKFYQGEDANGNQQFMEVPIAVE